MELKDFISETLKQVIIGVKIAQDFAKENGGKVNPKGISQTAASSHPHLYDSRGEMAQFIEFDIAISTTEEDKAKGGIGIFVGAIGVGVQGENGVQNSAINRIQFKVPLLLPSQE